MTGQRSGPLAVLRRQRWWLGRIAVLPLHILAFALATFFLVRLIPGDPARMIAGPEATPESYQAIRENLGFDGSLLAQLGHYMTGLIQLDLGNSISNGRPVLTEIGDRLGGTMELAVVAFTALVSASLLLSLVVVLRPRAVVSRMISGYAQTAGALPEFVVGVIGIFLFYATLRLVPAPLGRTRPGLREPESITGFPLLDAALHGNTVVVSSIVSHYLLPVIVLVISVSPLLLKQLLSALDETSAAPPTLFRVATGAPRRVVLLSSYRRALPPTIAMFGTVFGSLLGGAVILESLFGLGGLGVYAVTAVNATDLVALQGCLLVVAAISMVVFLAVDLVNMMLDPRRKPGVQGDSA